MTATIEQRAAVTVDAFNVLGTMNSVQIAIVAALRDGSAAERAKIVAWLRNTSCNFETIKTFEKAADAIERGEHEDNS